MIDSLLVINAGSSSIKFAVYPCKTDKLLPLLSCKFSNIGPHTLLEVKNQHGDVIEHGAGDQIAKIPSHELLMPWLLHWLTQYGREYHLVGVGHRVVHGGKLFYEPTLITPEVMTKLYELVPLAPLHQPHNLSAIAAIHKWSPDLPQIACFDTGFHQTQTHLAQLFALPRKYIEQGIVRYGFHGLSYQYIANSLPAYLGELSQGRVMVAHLGNGASVCAMNNRQSVATSMGFTALDGLVMGQRCGTLDAGVVLHLLQHYKMTVDEVQHLLYNESGLLGVSGISNNMQVLRNSDDPHAKEAIDLFCYAAARQLSSLVCDLKGLDAIVFTAGIGENSSRIRAEICEHLIWLGVAIDSALNDSHQTVISSAGSAVKVLIIPTNEELVIAQASKNIILG